MSMTDNLAIFAQIYMTTTLNFGIFIYIIVVLTIFIRRKRLNFWEFLKNMKIVKFRSIFFKSYDPRISLKFRPEDNLFDRMLLSIGVFLLLTNCLLLMGEVAVAFSPLHSLVR